jgi:polyhydroxyalkanoate synthesis regulator phasin
MDETLPDGRSVYEAAANATRPRVVSDVPEPPRPKLELPTPQPDVMPEPAVPAPPVPYDQAESNVMELSRLEREKPQDRNGRWKSFLLNGLAQMGRNAQIAAQTHIQNPLAYTLGGFAGGGVLGAVRPQTDEEIRNEAEKQRLRGEIGFDLKRQEAEADVNYKKARPQLEMRKQETDLAIEQERARIQQMVEQGKMTRAEADRKEKELDRQSREREGQLNRDSRERVAATTKDKDLKVPETFYRGKDDNKIKNDAMAEVLAKPEYHQTGMKPEVLQAYGGDTDRVMKAVRNGELKPETLFDDPSKGAMFQRDLAATYSRKAGEAQEFDRAVDMTSKSRSAEQMSYADFENVWQKFLDDYKAAKDPKSKASIRRDYEAFIRTKRLAND